jgi:hypothetical protein
MHPSAERRDITLSPSVPAAVSADSAAAESLRATCSRSAVERDWASVP